MNVSKGEHRRYWVTFLLEDLPVGASFKPDVLHINVIPWFVTEMEDAEVIESFYEKFSDFKALDVQVGTKTRLGPRNVSVNIIENRDKLIPVHQNALDWFNILSARWALKNPYVDDDYIPHIRRRDDTRLNEGEHLHLAALNLVSARREEDDIRQVAAKVSANG